MKFRILPSSRSLRPRLLAPFAVLAVTAACGGPRPTPAPPEAARPVVSPAEVQPGTAAAAPAEPAPSSTPAASVDGAARAAKSAPTRVAARHVLIQWMGCDRADGHVVRTRDQARVVVDEVLRRARAGEDLGRLAVEFSDEPNAAARGGSLGRFGRGQMVKAFEEVVFAMEPGAISDVVETPFGFHVIQRME